MDSSCTAVSLFLPLSFLFVCVWALLMFGSDKQRQREENVATTVDYSITSPVCVSLLFPEILNKHPPAIDDILKNARVSRI